IAHIYCEEVFGVVGENFTFPVKTDEKEGEVTWTKIFIITWTKNKDKVAEWEWRNKPKYFEHFHNRSVLMEDGSLTIINLKKNDAGTYELQYWDSERDHNLMFKLDVFDSFPEPKISCNSSGDNLALNCTADFQRPLNYSWKLSHDEHNSQSQNLSIPLEKVNHTMKATCIIKFSQIERSSEVSLIQCLP
ncbi:LFA3 protein, partial [Dasyornis broadbenti]|nr:LFA3 protein [Dasyornis broadbenti]